MTTAVRLLVMVPATPVNVADEVPAATVTEDGTLSSGELLESVTMIPPDPAACVKVTVQLVTHPELRVEGLQDNRLRDVAVSNESDAVCELPL